MKTKKAFAIILLVGILLNAGCKKNDNPIGPDNENAIMPLNLGNQWTFQMTSLDSLGNVTQRYDNGRMVDNVTIGSLIVSRDTMIQNERWYFFGPSSTASTLLTNRSDGLWMMTLGQVSWAPGLFAKYPAHLNETWLGPDSSTIKLTAGNITLTVPQGTFTCLQYSHLSKYNGDVTYTMYFSPGVGFVKEEQFAKTRGGRTFVQMRMELTGLTLNTSGSTTSDPSANAQIWNMVSGDGQIATVTVTPFTTASGTFSETSNSTGWWMVYPGGQLRIPVNGTISHTSQGDHWYWTITIQSPGVSFLGYGEGYSNGNFPNANSAGGVVKGTQTVPGYTQQVNGSWTATRK
jgi:hypothetical protein